MRRAVFVSLEPVVGGEVRFGTYRWLSQEWTYARSPCPVYPSYHFGSATAEAPEAVNAAVATIKTRRTIVLALWAIGR